MTKKDFIALADMIKETNGIISEETGENINHFSPYAIAKLADFCATQNPLFNRKNGLSMSLKSKL